MSKQPRDESNYPIPLLGYRLNGGQAIAVTTATTISSPIGSHTRVISLYSTIDCFLRLGM